LDELRTGTVGSMPNKNSDSEIARQAQIGGLETHVEQESNCLRLLGSWWSTYWSCWVVKNMAMRMLLCGKK
jgi:hypothetical protein